MSDTPKEVTELEKAGYKVTSSYVRTDITGGRKINPQTQQAEDDVTEIKVLVATVEKVIK